MYVVSRYKDLTNQKLYFYISTSRHTYSYIISFEFFQVEIKKEIKVKKIENEILVSTMDSSSAEVRKDVMNEALELFKVLRKKRKKSVNESQVKKEMMDNSVAVQNQGNLLLGIENQIVTK